jgi:hypothetical protein
MWNKIINPRPRIIVDTHAGSGIVNLYHDRDILKKRKLTKIYGSALIALIKTLKLSNNLKIILNEKDPMKFRELEKHVTDFINFGVPIFEEQVDNFAYKAFITKRKRKLKNKPKIIFPNSPNQKPPLNFRKKRTKIKAKVELFNESIENVIDEIIDIELSDSDLKEKKLKPVVLFFVDPCGIVSWNDVISKICKRSTKEEGTELILNWSWEAINRNLPTQNKNAVFRTKSWNRSYIWNTNIR